MQWAKSSLRVIPNLFLWMMTYQKGMVALVINHRSKIARRRPTTSSSKLRVKRVISREALALIQLKISLHQVRTIILVTRSSVIELPSKGKSTLLAPNDCSWILCTSRVRKWKLEGRSPLTNRHAATFAKKRGLEHWRRQWLRGYQKVHLVERRLLRWKKTRKISKKWQHPFKI